MSRLKKLIYYIWVIFVIQQWFEWKNQGKKCLNEKNTKIDPWLYWTHPTQLNVMFSKAGRRENNVKKKREVCVCVRCVRPSWAGGREVQMLWGGSEAENALPRLPPERDYSGASTSGSAQLGSAALGSAVPTAVLMVWGHICADTKVWKHLHVWYN